MPPPWKKSIQTIPSPTAKTFGFDGFHDMSENKFAVYDIDSDGKKELIVLYTTTYMAGMTGTVYAYDSSSGTLRAELQEFPSLTFYDNGAVVAEWSHNQGMAGDFWPYTVYSYNSGTDTYEQTAMVDAWDKSVGEKDYEGTLFPTILMPTETAWYIISCLAEPMKRIRLWILRNIQNGGSLHRPGTAA